MDAILTRLAVRRTVECRGGRALADTFPFATYFGAITTLADLQLRDGPRPFTTGLPAHPAPRDLLLYLGCNVLRTVHLATTAVAVLRTLGFDLNAVAGPAYCCGVIHHRAGEPDAARAYSGSTLRHLGPYEPAAVIMWCPSCHEHFDGVVSREHEIAFPYEHVTAFIARHLDRARFVRRVERRVALHFHTGHPQQELDRASTVAILEAIPGVEYLEVSNPPELGRHCSPTYIHPLGRPVWQRHVSAVAAAAVAAGADTLGTIYHSCHREICDLEGRHPVEVVSYITLLAEALGLDPDPDWYKHHRLAGDPDAAFEEVREWVEARGLDPARVRDVLADAFAPGCEAPARPAAPPVPGAGRQ